MVEYRLKIGTACGMRLDGQSERRAVLTTCRLAVSIEVAIKDVGNASFFLSYIDVQTEAW